MVSDTLHVLPLCRLANRFRIAYKPRMLRLAFHPDLNAQQSVLLSASFERSHTQHRVFLQPPS